MIRRWRKIAKDETGQVLPSVLVLLVMGGLLIAPCLGYASTSLNGSRALVRNISGLYAADAGVEDALWSLKHGTQPHTSLPQNLNGTQVTISTVNKGDCTLVAGEWVTTKGQAYDLLLSTNMTWDAGASAYKYTITCTWTGDGQCKLIKVGARLPVGYDYKPGSAALFGDNLSTSTPDNQLDGDGAHMLSWAFPKTILSPTRTQIFYATGSGGLQGDYGWAEATREDVGIVGELSGTLYRITTVATSLDSGETLASLAAEAMLNGGDLSIISWRINPQEE